MVVFTSISVGRSDQLSLPAIALAERFEIVAVLNKQHLPAVGFKTLPEHSQRTTGSIRRQAKYRWNHTEQSACPASR